MKEYYIVSLKHTSKGDTALTFWCAHSRGYTWDKNRVGVYSEEELDNIVNHNNVAVPVEVADKLWMNAIDFNDEYISIPNNKEVQKELGLSTKEMKETRFASCRMKFTGVLVNS